MKEVEGLFAACTCFWTTKVFLILTTTCAELLAYATWVAVVGIGSQSKLIVLQTLQKKHTSCLDSEAWCLLKEVPRGDVLAQVSEIILSIFTLPTDNVSPAISLRKTARYPPKVILRARKIHSLLSPNTIRKAVSIRH
jgi:hypothetical protein